MNKVYIKKLKSKMTVILIPFKTIDIVSSGVFIRTGSINETDENNGIAHFLEHMLFKGTKNRKGNKLAEQLDSKGAQYNAGTSKEYTYYYINGNSKDTNLFIDILADMYCNPLFTESSINLERKVVLEEFDMGLDDSGNVLMEILHKKLFPHSPLRLPVIGNKDCINKFTKHDFINFINTNYVYENTTFVVAGNFDKIKVLNKIQKSFHNEKKNNIVPAPSNIIVTHIVRQKSPYVYLKEKLSIGQTQVMFAFRSVDISDNHNFSLELLAEILSSGLSSKLFDLLRNKNGMTYFNYSYHLSYSTDGLFIIHIGVNNSRVFEAIKVLLDALNKLVKHGITDTELSKVKTIKQTAFKLNLCEPKKYMHFYGLTSIFENISKNNDPIKNFNENLKKIKKNDINNVIKYTFTRNNFNLFVYGDISDLENNLKVLEKLIDKSLS